MKFIAVSFAGEADGSTRSQVAQGGQESSETCGLVLTSLIPLPQAWPTSVEVA